MKERSVSPVATKKEDQEKASSASVESPSKIASNIFSIEEEEKHLRKMKRMLLMHKNAHSAASGNRQR